MQSIYAASRYILPVALAAYAVVANVAFLRQPEVPEVPLAWSSLQGQPTAELDGIYKKSLPHREASIGLWGAVRYLTTGEGRKGVLASEGWLFTSEEARVADDAALAAMVARVVGVRDALAAHGVELVMVPVPAKLDVQRDVAGHADLVAAMAAQYASFVGQVRDAGVPVAEVRAALMGREAFYRTDTHWNRVGVEAAAQAVADVVPRGDVVFAVKEGAAKAFVGDLVSYVTTDSMAPAVGLMQETMVPFVAVSGDAGGDLFGSGDADVVLVGTSYSANADWSFAEALKLALGRDVLNYAEQGQGPARPMLAYLASADLQDMPPQVVLWEFPVRYLADATIWDAPAVKVASNGN